MTLRARAFLLPLAALACLAPPPLGAQAPGLAEALEADHRAERARREEDMNAAFARLAQALRAWKELYLGFANWPSDAYMRADRRLQALVVEVKDFNGTVKDRPPETFTTEQRTRLLVLARRVQTGTGEPLPGMPLESTPMVQAWAGVVALDLLDRLRDDTRAALGAFEEAHRAGRLDAALERARPLLPSPVDARALGAKALARVGNPLDGPRAAGSKDAILERLERDLGAWLKVRASRIDGALSGPLEALRRRALDVAALGDARDGLGDRLRKLLLAEEILRAPNRLARPEAEAAAAALRGPLRAKLEPLAAPIPEKGIPAPPPPPDTPERCEEAASRWRTLRDAAQENLDLTAGLAELEGVPLAPAEEAGLLAPAQRRILQEGLDRRQGAKALKAQAEKALAELPARREALLAERRRAEADAPRLRVAALLRSATLGKGKDAVRLRNGEYTRPKGRDGTLNGGVRLVEDSVVLLPAGNRLGADAAFLAGDNWGGSADYVHLHLARVRGDRTEVLAGVNLGDRTLVKEVGVEGDRLTVAMLVHGEDDPLCCPTRPLRREYTLDGGSLHPAATAPERASILDELNGAFTERAALEITLGLDPQAIYAARQLNERIKEAKAREARARARVREFRLLKDPEFRRMVQARAKENRQIQDRAGGILGFQRMPAGQQRAYLVIGQVAIWLEGLLGR